MILSTAAPAFLDYKLYLRNVCAGSAYTYRGHLRRFIRAVGPRKSLGAAGKLAMPYLIAMGQRGRSEAYRAKAQGVLRDFYRWACENGHARANPLRNLKRPKIHDTDRTWLTLEQVNRLLAAIRASQTYHWRRDFALIATLYFTWARVSEMCRARPEDFDLDLCMVSIYGKGGRQRVVPFDPQLAPILRDWQRRRPKESPMMFPAKGFTRRFCGILNRDRVARVIRTVYAPAAGLAGRVTPHTLRRSGARHARDRGVRLELIQHVLRHKTITTTMVYLGVPSPDELKGVWRKSA